MLRRVGLSGGDIVAGVRRGVIFATEVNRSDMRGRSAAIAAHRLSVLAARRVVTQRAVFALRAALAGQSFARRVVALGVSFGHVAGLFAGDVHWNVLPSSRSFLSLQRLNLSAILLVLLVRLLVNTRATHCVRVSLWTLVRRPM